MFENLEQNQTPYDEVRQQAKADIQAELDDRELQHLSLEEIISWQERSEPVEVPYDPAMLETIASDDTDDNLDVDDDGGAGDLDREIISDLPQEVTQSYGTGLQGQPADRAGRYSRRTEQHVENDVDFTLTGGDVDANYDDAATVGDEAVGGTVATPDQDIVDEVAAAVGLELDDRTDVRMTAILEDRDERRWELDPKSSEDYEQRRG
jgi:hypothetical protein